MGLLPSFQALYLHHWHQTTKHTEEPQLPPKVLAQITKLFTQRYRSPPATDLGLLWNATVLSFAMQVCQMENPQAVGRIKMHLVLTVTIEHGDYRVVPKSHSFLQHNSIKWLLLLKMIKGLPLSSPFYPRHPFKMGCDSHCQWNVPSWWHFK